MNQSQAQRDEERAVFEAFLVLQPAFAGEPIAHWNLAESDPPDILCSTVSDRTVGVELGEWLHFAEMKAGKLRETIDRQLLDAIGAPQPLNTSDHFDMVILHPKDRVRIDAGPDRVAFRQAVFRLIADVDRRWPTERSWHYAAGCRIRELTPWPPLSVYLREVQFHPGATKWGEGIDWILPPAPFDSFDDQTMVEPLLQLISDKLGKYRKRPMGTSCDELVLLVFFNQGLMYNSPLGTALRDAARVRRRQRLQTGASRGICGVVWRGRGRSPVDSGARWLLLPQHQGARRRRGAQSVRERPRNRAQAAVGLAIRRRILLAQDRQRRTGRLGKPGRGSWPYHAMNSSNPRL